MFEVNKIIITSAFTLQSHKREINIRQLPRTPIEEKELVLRPRQISKKNYNQGNNIHIFIQISN